MSDWKLKNIEYQVIPDMKIDIQDLKTSLEYVLSRLATLEEKERARARDEHERDVS